MGEAIGNILKTADEVLKDDWQPGSDIPPIMTTALTSLLGVASEVKNIPADAKAEPWAFGKGALIPILEGIEVIVK
jgi:hypothetical protein